YTASSARQVRRSMSWAVSGVALFVLIISVISFLGSVRPRLGPSSGRSVLGSVRPRVGPPSKAASGHALGDRPAC
ncbi:hypothetical protein ABZ372_40170, partial [Streptomyces sp. NPDC005921]